MMRTLGELARQVPVHVRTRLSLKLTAVPKDPVAGDRAVGEALLAGHIVHGNERIAIEALDFARSHLSRPLFDYLHSFAWLRDLAAAATREKGGPIAEKIVRRWLGSCAIQQKGPSWSCDLWGRRILFWAAYAPYIHTSSDASYRSALLSTLVRGARFLDRSADQASVGLGRVTAWSGAMAAALLVQGSAVRVGRAENALLRALGEALHDDGGLVSRSPEEQLAMVELLGQLRALYFASRRRMPSRLQEALSASAAALAAVTLGDGALSSWQGGNMLSKRRLSAALKGAGVPPNPDWKLGDWGYQRLSAKGTIVIFDGAPPPPFKALTGACASTLAFEFSDGPVRIVVNCGGTKPWQSKLATELSHALRFTAAHSTLTLDDRNSTAILGEGLLGQGVRHVEVVRESTAGAIHVQGSHDGYVRRFGLLHMRELHLSGDGRQLCGEDRLVPRRRWQTEAIPFAVRFHLDPAVRVESSVDRQSVTLRAKGDRVWEFAQEGGSLAIEESLWIDGGGLPHRTSQIVCYGDAPPDGTVIEWVFRRMA